MIPEMTDPMSKYWEQPGRHLIAITNETATMSLTTFRALGEYSLSIPTGTYIGKMWKCKGMPGQWYLRWYNEIEGNDITIVSRLIKITLTDREFCQVVIEWARDYLSRGKK